MRRTETQYHHKGGRERDKTDDATILLPDEVKDLNPRHNLVVDHADFTNVLG